MYKPKWYNHITAVLMTILTGLFFVVTFGGVGFMVSGGLYFTVVTFAALGFLLSIILTV